MEHTVDCKQLRSFGLIVGGIFAVLGLWPSVFRQEDPRVWALALGALLIFPAIVVPQVLKWPYHLWMRIGLVLGWINSRIIMTIAFYAIFTPVGMIRRIKTDPMNRKFEPESESYRVKREVRPPSHMTHQF